MGCRERAATATGQLEQPVAAGHHNLGRVGVFPSSASRKAESSQGESNFLDPGPGTQDTTMGSLLWTTATSPLFQHQGTPSTPSSTSISPCGCSAFVSHTSLILQNHLFLSTLSQAFCWIAFLKESDYQVSAIARELGGDGSCFKYYCAHGHTLTRHKQEAAELPSASLCNRRKGRR